ncbi:MAG: tRNA 2-thiouridine(34) synthase MnmA [Thermonemataceae bacterium]|nr:tRNA 2-thiouridine(34) synthase MnmA [Thermonemataceae bacterium]
MPPRVVVGLSGGVDSSVAAYLLKEQGYEVIGIFMKNWHDERVVINNECPWVEDSNDALIVAEKLGIPFRVLDLSAEYKQRIVDYMFAEYEAGRTPNPDVLCNREIKFDVFLKAALQLGADYVATGHYCQKSSFQKEGYAVHQLLMAKDNNKDQSYFLCQLSQEQLSKALFPIGHLLKSEVRAIAKAQDLVTAEKKDSQGLCFVGKIRLPEFLQQKLNTKKGKIIEIPPDSPIFSKQNTSNSLEDKTNAYVYAPADGKVVGEHIGAHFYTIGQRKGLQVGGKALPLFVIGIDVNENIVYVGQGNTHQGLNRRGLRVAKNDIHWVRPDLEMKIGDSQTYQVRIRYRQPLSKATLYQSEEFLYVIFEEKQQSVTPGQFVTWYENNELIGSGVIN